MLAGSAVLLDLVVRRRPEDIGSLADGGVAGSETIIDGLGVGSVGCGSIDSGCCSKWQGSCIIGDPGGRSHVIGTGDDNPRGSVDSSGWGSSIMVSSQAGSSKGCSGGGEGGFGLTTRRM